MSGCLNFKVIGLYLMSKSYCVEILECHNYPKFTLRRDCLGTLCRQIKLLLEKQTDQGLHYLQFRLHCLLAICCMVELFRVITANMKPGVPKNFEKIRFI